MKKYITIILVPVTFVLLALHPIFKSPAVEFLNSLNKEQRDKAQFPFDHTSKTFWHYFPASMTPRAGIQLMDLNTNQKELFSKLLQSFLSEAGYAKTQKIISLEHVLLEATGDSVMRHPEKYHIAFYGNPETDSLWAWSFEGHHVSLNFTVLNGTVSVAPRFFGANPATILSGSRKGERTLNTEEDLGLDLIISLSETQRKIAIFQERSPYDIATGNTPKAEPLKPVGIMFGNLSDDQQMIFLKLINEYLSSVPKDQANKKLAEIQNEDLNSIRFGWAGPTSLGKGHYYRIQGQSFLIEFDNTQNNANHIHSVWRDFKGDFGRDLISEHYKNAEHHKN
ncbi:DUF3500 domain-containing protein [Flavobacteriaceae bacterium XHP0103]|uniref:DUF3500 domain-containing protein n=1 Tax=Marixanthotalea marina TaxID=2844359 RepID=UPI002989EF11|nr:DUF3500 domain-containing protein [Marixanthotalea marina]MBU3821136.1 DUF3500 domain-containing protein [Marixanthotalea marina]